MEERAAARRCAVVLVAVYAALALLVVAEQAGRTTNDTRLELTEQPADYLAGTFSLWNPQVSLGELQNQAYGYLFPQGLWYVALDLVGMPGWLSQRLWSVLLLLLACEGVRRVARHVVADPWAAAAAGLVYGLAPRHVTELGVRSAEILPGAVLPWALLPILQAVEGRRRPRDAAVLSAAAYACAGGVNGTATAAPAALLIVFVGWAVLRRHLSWRFAAGWVALMAVVNAWWVGSLLQLGRYSPPFFDYVEDARATTWSSGFAPTLRGTSNWVGYIVVDGERWWPAGHLLSYEPWAVVGTGLLAVVGLVGLLRHGGRFRVPLLLSAALGLTCQVIAHTGPLDGPLSQWLQDLLDGPLAPLRNVAKADPVLRVPLAVGVAVAVADAARLLAVRGTPRRSRVAARVGAGVLVAALVAGLGTAAAPVVRAETRTPGWEEVPGYWRDAAAYVAERRDRRLGDRAVDGGTAVTWVIPGAGFGIHEWGWTMEEVMQAIDRSPWVTRSQVPLTPAATIRMLTALETYLETGSGSPYLQAMLARIGIDTVLVRHDLDADVAVATPSNLVSVALARSPGLRRVRTFGALDFGPAIEVFEVQRNLGAAESGGYDVRDTADAVTVASAPEDAVAAVGAGLVGPAQPVLLEGTPGWDRPADVVGDGWRRRERSFSRILEAESNVMTADEPRHGRRVVADYPGPPGAEPVVAAYRGVAGVAASSSRGWVDILGSVQAEAAPDAVLDGDSSTSWRPAPYVGTEGEWVRVDLAREQPVGRVELQQPVDRADLDLVTRWRVSAGGTTRTVTTDEATGRAVADLGGVRARSVRVEVAAVPHEESGIGLAEVRVAGVHPERTLVLPEVPQAGTPDLVLAARPETRACITTLLGPDCSVTRRRGAEEAAGIDRTFTVDAAGRWGVRGLAVARATPSAAELLLPWGGPQVRATSVLADDPAVGPRMVHDGDDTTLWLADGRDPAPALTVDLGRRRVLRGLDVVPPAGFGAMPDRAVVEAGGRRREVDLSGSGAFEPMRARRVRVTFLRDVPDARPTGVAELRLRGGRLTAPFDGAAEAGTPCGFGPPLVVDGRRFDTRVQGAAGSVVSAGQLALRVCGSRAERRLRLDPGVHRVRLLSTPQFQPVGLTLLGLDGDRTRVVERSRSLRLLDADATRVRLDVGTGEEAVLSTPHNHNAGWVATLDGRELEPVTVDGWAQGWLVPADAAGEVELSFAPQRGYLVGLVGGLVLLVGVLLWALWIVVRRGRQASGSDERAGPAPPVGGGRAGPTAAGVAGLALAAGAVAWLVGGPLVGAGAAGGVVLGRWPRVVQVLVAAAVLVALGLWVVEVARAPEPPSAAVDLVTGTAFALAVAAGLLGGRGRATDEAA